MPLWLFRTSCCLVGKSCCPHTPYSSPHEPVAPCPGWSEHRPPEGEAVCPSLPSPAVDVLLSVSVRLVRLFPRLHWQIKLLGVLGLSAVRVQAGQRPPSPGLFLRGRGLSSPKARVSSHHAAPQHGLQVENSQIFWEIFQLSQECPSTTLGGWHGVLLIPSACGDLAGGFLGQHGAI